MSIRTAKRFLTVFFIVWLGLVVYAGVSLARSAHRYPATLVCRHLAEDSAAHVRLVKYEDGHIVYRCTRRGY